MKWLLAIAAGVAGYFYFRGLDARRTKRPREELNRWEGEGGNVSVTTPMPHYIPAGDPAVRH